MMSRMFWLAAICFGSRTDPVDDVAVGSDSGAESVPVGSGVLIVAHAFQCSNWSAGTMKFPFALFLKLEKSGGAGTASSKGNKLFPSSMKSFSSDMIIFFFFK